MAGGAWLRFGSGKDGPSTQTTRAPATPAPPQHPSSPASARIFRIVDDQLTEERNTKTSLETRASDVIKSSGTLTTLFLAIGAVSGAARVHLDWWSITAFVLAVATFVASAWIAISVASPRAYQELKIDDLRAIMRPEIFDEPDSTAGPKLTKPYLDMLEAARKANRTKADRLTLAIRFEVVGVGLAALAAASTLISSALAA